MSAERFDVGIVGAGPAGLAAAIGAARQGARVVIIERRRIVGGNATGAMVGTICGVSRCGPHLHTPPRFDNPGFATEFSRRVAERSRKELVRNPLGLTYLPYISEAFEAVSGELVAEHPATSLLTEISISAIERMGPGGGFVLRMSNAVDRHLEIQAATLVDCSGNSEALKLLNLPTVAPSPSQAAALVFEVSGLPDLDEQSIGFTVRKLLREAVLDDTLPDELSYISIVPGSLSHNRALFKLGTAAPTTERHEAWTEQIYSQLSCSIPRIVSYLKGHGSGLQSIFHSGTAPALGIRSGDRGLGEEELSTQAVRLSQRHIKGIAVGLWPVELWDSPAKPKVTFPDKGEGYEIPIGSLCAKGIDGVYFAGRGLAATDYAIGSARVIGTSLSTGYAAGWLAAGRLQGQSEDDIVRALREQQVEPLYYDRNTPA